MCNLDKNGSCHSYVMRGNTKIEGSPGYVRANLYSGSRMNYNNYRGRMY